MPRPPRTSRAEGHKRPSATLRSARRGDGAVERVERSEIGCDGDGDDGGGGGGGGGGGVGGGGDDAGTGAGVEGVGSGEARGGRRVCGGGGSGGGGGGGDVGGGGVGGGEGGGGRGWKRGLPPRGGPVRAYLRTHGGHKSARVHAVGGVVCARGCGVPHMGKVQASPKG